jgi:hypothetical protein
VRKVRSHTRENLLIFIILTVVLVALVLVTPVEYDVWIVLFGVFPVALFAYYRGVSVKHAVRAVTESAKRVRWAEIRKSMATSLNVAFGLTIGLVWTNVVNLGFAAAGIPLTPGLVFSVASWALYVGASFVVTFVCLIGIYLTSRWREAVEEIEEAAEKEKKR